MRQTEQGWFPDFLYRAGKFESGMAVFANAAGVVTRYSSEPGDLSKACRLANRVLLPGLVNAHSHAFQRAIRARAEQPTSAQYDSFWTWREAMYRAANMLSPDDIFDVSRMAFLEMLLSGITTVGEFHYLHHSPLGERYHDPNLLGRQVIRAAQEVGLRIILLRGAYARAGWQTEPNPGQARFLTPDVDVFLKDTEALAQSFCSDRVSVGVAPHSIRAVPLPYLLEVIRYGRTRNMPIHMHVAEQPTEITACQSEHGLRPVELLAEHGALADDFTAVHATHTTDHEISLLSGANICVCPTTERNLGDGIASADCWHHAGINVCFGSDSNIQIDLLEDARELEYHLRLKRLERSILPEQRLFGHATTGGLRSLRTEDSADFFTIDLADPSVASADRDSLLSHIIFAAQRSAIREVYVAGEEVIASGNHKDQEQIIERFIAVQRRIWS
jgi:formimidoylglutamate deiminase